MAKFAFGDIIENPYYQSTHPYRKGIFMEKTSAGDYRMTDGKKHWKIGRDANNLLKLGNVLDGDKL